MVDDFDTTNSFTWDPLQEGTYDIEVIVKNSFAAASGESAIATCTVQTRITGASAVIVPPRPTL